MRYGKAETLALLDAAGVPYDLAEHEAVFTVEEAHAADVPFTEYGDKNLFLRDDKKRSYYLVCMHDQKRRSIKEIQLAVSSARRLSFASERDLAAKLGVIPGAVTPLAALNDTEHVVQVFIDQSFIDLGRIAVHPCDNTATVLLRTNDLMALLQDRGSRVQVVDF